MTIDREEIRRRVQRALEDELRALAPSQAPAKPPVASSAPMSSAPMSSAPPRAAAPAPLTPPVRGPSIVTESDVAEWIRAGRSSTFPPETRFTPLARETYERELNRAPPRAPTAIRDIGVSATDVAPTRSAGARDAIAVGADHGGFALKEALKTHLVERGFEVVDCGTHSTDACDYPVFARAVAEHVRAGSVAAGIVVDGAGIGSAMAANKVPGVRAAACHNEFEARNAREHNHAQVLTLGAGLIGRALAVAIVDTFLATPFGDGRHARRVALIEGTAAPGNRGEALQRGATP
ncbi:MAG: ribose 5-phosphate isomerase B [Planctomycetota bacterium]